MTAALRSTIGTLVLAGAVALPSARAGVPTVIFSNLASSPTSDVPGLAGVKFNPGTTTQFDRPFTIVSLLGASAVKAQILSMITCAREAAQCAAPGRIHSSASTWNVPAD